MIYLMVYCSDNRTQNNAQTKQSKMELYTLNLGHISPHFYHHDKTLKKEYLFFRNTNKYLCEQIEHIFFPRSYISFLPEANFLHFMQKFFRLNVTERHYFIRINTMNGFLFEQI